VAGLNADGVEIKLPNAPPELGDAAGVFPNTEGGSGEEGGEMAKTDLGGSVGVFEAPNGDLVGVPNGEEVAEEVAPSIGVPNTDVFPNPTLSPVAVTEDPAADPNGEGVVEANALNALPEFDVCELVSVDLLIPKPELPNADGAVEAKAPKPDAGLVSEVVLGEAPDPKVAGLVEAKAPKPPDVTGFDSVDPNTEGFEVAFEKEVGVLANAPNPPVVGVVDGAPKLVCPNAGAGSDGFPKAEVPNPDCPNPEEVVAGGGVGALNALAVAGGLLLGSNAPVVLNPPKAPNPLAGLTIAPPNIDEEVF